MPLQYFYYGKFLHFDKLNDQDMKNYEKQLLNKMHLEQSVYNNEPLKNVKEGLGSIGFIKGNPLTKTEITINYSLNFFTGTQGGIEANDTFGALSTGNFLPTNLRGKFPAFLLGLTDYYAGYTKMLKTIKPSAPWEAINNLGYKQSNNLFGGGAGYLQAAYWNVINPIWNNFGALSINTDPAQLQGNLIKNNFWQIGHLYKIIISARVKTPGVAFRITAPYDGVNFNNTQVVWDSSFNFTYNYIPETTDLYLTATNNTDGSIYRMEIYEITGYLPFTGEPAMGIYGLTKNNVLSPEVEIGDLVLTYTAKQSIGLQTIVYYIAEIIIHCSNVAYGTFLNSFVSDLITINTLRYIVPIANVNQFINPVIFTYQTLFGKAYTDSVDSRMFITSKDFQQQIADLPINLPIDKAMALGVNIDYDCPRFSMILFVEKIEALTHK